MGRDGKKMINKISKVCNNHLDDEGSDSGGVKRYSKKPFLDFFFATISFSIENNNGLENQKNVFNKGEKRTCNKHCIITLSVIGTMLIMLLLSLCTL